MPNLITFSTFMLFWVFYEISGGAEFAPAERTVMSQAPFAQTSTNAQTAYVDFGTPIYSPAPTRTDAVEVAMAPDTTDHRIVAANRVNLRQGPGTDHAVLDTVTRGATAQLIKIQDTGWAQVRLIDSGQTGWMAARLLSEG